MKVIKITEDVINEMKGKALKNGNVFNPVKDNNDNWIISKEQFAVMPIKVKKEFIDYEPIVLEEDIEE